MTAFRLTPKQEKFCAVYLETGNASEAYRQAYKTENMSPATIRGCAAELMRNPNITARLNKSKAEIVERVVFDKQTAIQYALEDRALARELGQTGAAVSAARLACDIAGHIVEKKDTTIRFEELSREQLIELLAALDEPGAAGVAEAGGPEKAGATRH